MRGWEWTLSLLIACSPAALPPETPAEEPQPTPEATPTPPKADEASGPPPPGVGIACDRNEARTCASDQPLRCVAGSGGAKWMAEPLCGPGLQCVLDWGCLPLPPCFDAGQLNCVDQRLYVCEAETELTWRHATDCPSAIRCIDGRGCPNPHGIGTECSFTDPPRCADTRIMRCMLSGIDSIWGAPEDCPTGSTCEPGRGCEDEDNGRRPTRPIRTPLPD